MDDCCRFYNVEEVEKSLNISLRNENEKLNFLHELYYKNIKLSFLTDGANPVYASKFNFHYKIVPPEVKVLDSTGSGDAFVAGIAYGLENALVFDEFIKIAAALGTANSTMIETCEVTSEQMRKYAEHIEVMTIGKKMKIINDTPNYK